MSTIFPGSTLFNINGVIDTNKSVLQNINILSTAAGAFVTYDISDGLWSVIINGPANSVASFNDSNIIGAISVSGTGIADMYNSVSVEFPHKDIRDQTDYVDLKIDDSLRYPNELDNNLNISLDCINDPIQAQYIGSVELKQSRIDRIIQFVTDYSKLGLKAGDVISVTASQYGFTNKLFRIITMQENDEDGVLISITALEYDSTVYDSSGLIRTERNKKTGILPKAANTALTNNETAGLVNKGIPVVQSANIQTFGGLLQTASPLDAANITTIPFTAAFTAPYLFNILFDQDAGGAQGSPNDVVVFQARLLNSDGLVIAEQLSGGPGAWYWTDLLINIRHNLTAGNNYALQLNYVNFTPSNPAASMTVTVSWQIYTIVSA